MAFIRDCCSSFIAQLPDPALPLVPAMTLAAITSAIILIVMYKVQTKMSFKELILDIGRSIFFALPDNDQEHSTSQACRNKSCVRCHRYKDVQKRLIKKYDEITLKQTIKFNVRIEDGVRAIKQKCHPALNINTEDSKSKDVVRSPLQKPTLFAMNLAANPIWNDFDVFPMELDLLKLNFEIIFGEFKEVYKRLNDGKWEGWKSNDIPKGHWCVYPFIDQGVVNDKNCRTCPNTATMIGSLPSVMKDCVFGNASFSLLYPDSHIEPHHGPTNLRLRCHLGLNVPSGCWFEVAGKQVKWAAKKTLVFDDSFEHSATFIDKPHSDQNHPRAILMVDFWHPDVSEDEREILEQLLAP